MTVEYSPELDELSTTTVGVLVMSEAAAQDAVADQLVVQLLALWAAFSAYYDGDAVQLFGDRSAALVRDAQRRTGGITEQHLRRQYQQLGVELPRQIVELPDDLRLGADTDDVYQRPVRKLRYLMAEAMDEEEAALIAAERIELQALTDLQLAKVTAAQQFIYAAPDTSAGVTTGWRRIIHPELGSVCGLCVAASDRVYQRIERMDLHPGCKCTVLPIVQTGSGVRDPGRVLNAADLAAIYAAAGDSTASRKLAATRVQIAENGELGQILMADGSVYKGPDTVRSQLSSKAAERRLASIQGQLAKLRAIENPTQWYIDRAEQLEELLAAG